MKPAFLISFWTIVFFILPSIFVFGVYYYGWRITDANLISRCKAVAIWSGASLLFSSALIVLLKVISIPSESKILSEFSYITFFSLVALLGISALILLLDIIILAYVSFKNS